MANDTGTGTEILAKYPNITREYIDPRIASGSFSATVPFLQTAWDSVSLGTYKDCPRKYQYLIVEGWTSRHMAMDLRFGILYHRALEVYDHKRADGDDHETALRACLWDLAQGCIDEVPCATEQDEDGRWVHSRFDWWDPNSGLSEAKAKLNPKTLPALFRTVVWKLDRFEDDPIHTVILSNGKPAVELSFRFELGTFDISGEPIMYSGHLDRLGEYSGEHYVVDSKTTKTTLGFGYFDKYSPDNQMSGYIFGGQVTLQKPVKGAIIDAAQIAKGFTRFERGFVTRTPGQLDEWRQDALYWIGQAEQNAIAQYWPMNDKSCDKYGGCPLRDICSKDPKVRGSYLNSLGMVKRPWDPLAVRGDI